MAVKDNQPATSLPLSAIGRRLAWSVLLAAAASVPAIGCSSIGSTTTTKKAVSPYNSATKGAKGQSQPKTQEKSWLSQMLQPAEPERPRSPTEWIGQKRVDW